MDAVSMRTILGVIGLMAWGMPLSPANSMLTLSADGTTVYDTANNISWLADANLGASNRFGLPLCTTATVPCLA